MLAGAPAPFFCGQPRGRSWSAIPARGTLRRTRIATALAAGRDSPTELSMAHATVANQKKILKNQAAIVRNQRAILGNQKKILANQKAILRK
jgi:hypothetical protein